MNNLLIGGSGFIGSALGQVLINHNEKVVSVSLLGGGDAPGVTSIEVDLYKENCPPHLINEADDIFVLNIGQIRQGFDADLEKEVVIKLAQSLQHSQARIFFFSSVAVYGNTPQKATEATPCLPMGDYGKFKLEAEAIFKTYIKPEQLVIMRLANIYGTPRNKGFVGLVMANVFQGNPSIQLNGDGSQKRDYVFIDDLIEAILAIKAKPSEAGTVNISTGVSHSLLDVIGLISDVSGQQIAYQTSPTPLDEPQDSLIDNTKLRRVFDYTTFTPLQKGLATTYKRYQKSES